MVCKLIYRTAILATAALALSTPVLAYSGSNGVYGGFVGLSQWFHDMSHTAIASSGNGSWRSNIARGLASGEYAEVMFDVHFPGGNPFPDKRTPDLQVIGPDGKDVGCWPYTTHKSNDDSVYYLILRKGAMYRMRWMYYTGGTEQFARLYVRPGNARQRRVVFNYRSKATSSNGGASTSTTPYHAPVSDHDFKKPQSDGGFHPPVSDHSFHAPVSDNNFHAPVSDGGK